ncbi:membrane protease YdiL (CAAX protease family) [Nocardiopsis arvandica]|uniref:Membrane protease YdiL (CAAX protease family) n=1 Tax=Nocardiopsis sinuspersici TaxID=501010 RepID=A0A7Y9XHX1_9ACTN|nr:CPBP family intramembrane glutamic endopeptidase [Nocardiopsis sinuspersici]NYH54838.1 membrane protease YdiL (CAAX protease family) [Nocardiopsis sinuspersici]
MTSPTIGAEPEAPPPEPEPLPYHRLARARSRPRWWRMPLTAVLTAVFCLVAVVLFFAGLDLAAFLGVGGGVLDDLDTTMADTENPLGLVLALCVIALLLPCVLLAARICGPRPVGLLSSVEGRLRWRWTLHAAGISAAVYALSVPALLLAGNLAGTAESVPAPSGWTLVAMLAAVLLVVPLQAAAEEYVFRGVAMQTIGSWLRHPVFAVALPIPLFVLGHDYGWVGLTDVAVFAVMAGWLTWRTGGLEAAIAVHVVNNLCAFGLSAFGWKDESPTALVITLLVSAALVFLLDRAGRRRGLARVRPCPRPAAALEPCAR